MSKKKNYGHLEIGFTLHNSEECVKFKNWIKGLRKVSLAYLDRGYYVRSCNKSFWQHRTQYYVLFFPREHFVESAVFLQRSSEGHYQKFYTVVMTKVADKKGRERWSQMHTPYTNGGGCVQTAKLLAHKVSEPTKMIYCVLVDCRIKLLD